MPRSTRYRGIPVLTSRSKRKHPLAPTWLALIACALASVGLAGCGASAQSTHRRPAPVKSPPISSVINVRAVSTPGYQPYRFNVTHLTAKAGRIEIRFTNGDTADVTDGHNFRIQTGRTCCFGPGSQDLGGTQTLDPGTRSTVFVTLKPGRYYFLCSIGGHWQHHMQGVLVVS